MKKAAAKKAAAKKAAAQPKPKSRAQLEQALKDATAALSAAGLSVPSVAFVNAASAAGSAGGSAGVAPAAAPGGASSGQAASTAAIAALGQAQTPATTTTTGGLTRPDIENSTIADWVASLAPSRVPPGCISRRAITKSGFLSASELAACETADLKSVLAVLEPGERGRVRILAAAAKTAEDAQVGIPCLRGPAGAIVDAAARKKFETLAGSGHPFAWAGGAKAFIIPSAAATAAPEVVTSAAGRAIRAAGAITESEHSAIAASLETVGAPLARLDAFNRALSTACAKVPFGAALLDAVEMQTSICSARAVAIASPQPKGDKGKGKGAPGAGKAAKTAASHPAGTMKVRFRGADGKTDEAVVSAGVCHNFVLGRCANESCKRPHELPSALAGATEIVRLAQQ